MAYKPGENDLMAYLYGELEGKEKEALEKFLLENVEARLELERLKQVRMLLGQVEDKEVIAPPIFVGDNKPGFWIHAPYLKTIVSIAASLILVILVGRLAGLRISYSDTQLTLGFGTQQPAKSTAPVPVTPALTEMEIQQMINASLQQNNSTMQASWSNTEKKLDASIERGLAQSSAKIDNLVRESSAASQQQIRDFVAGMQTENMQLVKNYFQLNSTEQKKYVESLLVDFAKYLQEQRNNDLQVVQTQLKSMEKNTDIFKQETEQILSGIITTVGNPSSRGAKN